MFRVKFVVHCKGTRSDQALRIVGNRPELGSWNPLRGLPMEEYYEAQWESYAHIEIPNGHEFEFKIVKVSANNAVEWEELPNNANRKFKPKFHVKLVLTWSTTVGQALNQAKSSVNVNGLPGVMVHGSKKEGMLKRNPFKAKNRMFEDNSDSEEENENDSFCNVINRKKSADIRESISEADLQQIYYETTQLENAYQNYRQTQIFLVFSAESIDQQFIEAIQPQVEELFELENIKLKWLICGDQLSPTLRLNQKKVELIKNKDKICLEDFIKPIFSRHHFIILDLATSIKAVTGHTSACVYLSEQQYDRTTEYVDELTKFSFICFNNGKANEKLFRLFSNKQQGLNKSESSSHVPCPHYDMLKNDKQFGDISLEKVIQELQFCKVSESMVNTVHTYSKSQVLESILVPNSVLILDSEILSVDKKFFQSLIDEDCQKRLIIVVHEGAMPDWFHEYLGQKNICFVFENFTKIYFFGKIYDPEKMHRSAIDFIKMRAKLCKEELGGSWTLGQNQFNYEIRHGTEPKFVGIKNQIENVLKKQYDYFKIFLKKDRVLIRWNLVPTVRLLRTFIKIKTIEEGPVGSFFLVTQNPRLIELKQQVKMLININHQWMVNGKQTKVLDFGLGPKINCKYSIQHHDSLLPEGLTSKEGQELERASNQEEKILVQ